MGKQACKEAHLIDIKVPDLIPGPLTPDNEEYVRLTTGIEEKATKAILFEGYGLKQGSLLPPKEVNKITDKLKVEEDEKSGRTLIRSEEFQSALLTYFTLEEFELNETKQIEEFRFEITLNHKTIHVPDLSFIDGDVRIEWKDIQNLFELEQIEGNGPG